MSNKRIDLLAKFPLLRRILRMRSFQFLAILPFFFFFFLLFLAGIFGSPVGNRNIMIVFVWIFWWALLMAILVPFASRIWCMVCPLPIVGEWLQRLSLIGVRIGNSIGTRNRLFGLNLRWPSWLNNCWIQNGVSISLAVFSILLVTRPIISVAVLGGMIIFATVFMLIYRMRVFCVYVCPVGGFVGLYSMAATLELRAKDPQTCKTCGDKNCVRGSEDNYACPWFQYPGTMDRNNYCGLCTECLKNCAHDNITLNARPFGSDTRIEDYAEAWRAFIMIAMVMFYSIVMLGPWATPKDWANISEVGNWSGWGIYTVIKIGAAVAGLPAIYYVFIRLSRWASGARDMPIKDLFIRYAYAFVPLGLLAWVAFSIHLITTNGTYIVSVISDPFGWGWDLFGTVDFPWRPLIPSWVPFIQVALLMTGLVFALTGAYRVGRALFDRKDQVIRSLIPLSVLLTTVAGILMWLYVG